MAQATTNAAIEAGLHAVITTEAKESGISFSEQVNRYRVMALEKIREDKIKQLRHHDLRRGGIE